MNIDNWCDIKTLYKQREQLLIEIDNLYAAKSEMFDGLTSATSAITGMPHCSGDFHKFDNFVEASSELDGKIEELTEINAKIAIQSKKFNN